MVGSAILLPFPVSVEPGVFGERAERSAGRQQPPMGQDTLWNGGKKNPKTWSGPAKKPLLNNPNTKLEALP